MMNRAHIDCNSMYCVTYSNGSNRQMSGSEAALICFNGNENLKPCVKEIKRVIGCWYQILVRGKPLFSVYAESNADAQAKRQRELNNLSVENSDVLIIEESTYLEQRRNRW